MSDIYNIFSLPPPPPPTFLSFYKGPDRARLPNFLASDDPVAAAHQFLHNQIMFVCIPSIWTQTKIVTALAGLILLTALAVIVRRLFQRSLWFLRVKQTEGGKLIVPNAIMVFACTEGLFVILFLALINKIYVAWVIDRKPLENLILWIGTTWTPLIAGPIWSAFGVWHARPPSSTPAKRGKKTFLGIPVPGPNSLFVSILCLLTPFCQMLSVLGPCLKGNRYRQEAVALFYDWNSRYTNAPELTRDMLVELQEIWAKDLRGFFWLAICMFVWFGWCVMLFIIYGGVTLRLLLPLRAQLLALRERNAKRVQAGMVSGAKSANQVDLSPKSQIESVQLPLETPRLRSLAANYVGGRLETVDFQRDDVEEEEGEAAQEMAGDEAIDQHWGLKAADLKKDAPNPSFFPPIRPSAVVRAAPDSETSERYLRAAYNHFLFQGATVSVAIVYFSEVTIYLALTLYSYNERMILGRAIDAAFLQAMWGCVLFGSFVFISITIRTYEPVLVNLLTNNSQMVSSQRTPTGSNAQAENKSGQTGSRGFRLGRLTGLRSTTSEDQKRSFVSSQGGTTMVNSPTPTPRIPAMEPVHENGRESAQQRRDAEPESWAIINSRAPVEVKRKESPVWSETPTNDSSARLNGSTRSRGPPALRRADILASARTPEYELASPPLTEEQQQQQQPLQRHISRPSHSTFTPLYSNDTTYRSQQSVEPVHQLAQQQQMQQQQQQQQAFFTTSYQGGLNFLDSTSSLNDRSLREMPSATNLHSSEAFRRAVTPYGTGSTHSSASPKHGYPEHFAPRATGSGGSPTSTSSGMNQPFGSSSAFASAAALPRSPTSASFASASALGGSNSNADFVSGLRGSSPSPIHMQDEQQRSGSAIGFRSPFMNEMFGVSGETTPLPPPPRSARRPSRTSNSS
ncbi:hypothetical protein OC844_005737 [Tilletia horrida]|nr:hypothetical protein OC844_005737 [Tilletia horrida]